MVQANLLAAVTPHAKTRVFNVALGNRTTLNELFVALRAGLVERGYPVGKLAPDFGPFREGDVRHSLAALDAIREQLGYAPEVGFEEGLARTLDACLAPRCEPGRTTP
ncbi:MAG: UDP-N-acetylglucosamine 4-epimerase [Planctomycetota bacterium]